MARLCFFFKNKAMIKNLIWTGIILMIPSIVLAQAAIPFEPIQEADPARTNCPVRIELPQNETPQSNDQPMQAADSARIVCPVGIELPLQYNEQPMQAADSSVIHHQEIEPENIPNPEVNPNPNMTKSSTITDVDVVLYPTPATDVITVSTPDRQPDVILVYDLSGRLVMELASHALAANSNTLNVAHLQRGQYLIILRYSTGEENGALLSFIR
jgi:hypothetical protein